MSSGAANVDAGALERAGSVPVAVRARAYFASDTQRTIQTVLGLIWLLDGGLQFQSFMYGKGFIQLAHELDRGQPALGLEQRDLGREQRSTVTRPSSTLRSRWFRSRSASDCCIARRSSRRWRRRSDGRWSCGGSARRSG